MSHCCGATRPLSLSSPSQPCGLLGHAVRYGRWRRTPTGAVTAPARAYDDEKSRLGGGVEVQPGVDATVELILSVRREDTFGPVVTVRLGGVMADLLGDRAFGLLPLTDREAASMLRSLPVAPLL